MILTRLVDRDEFLAVWPLLAEAVGTASDARRDTLAHQYGAGPSVLFILRDGERVAGVVGVLVSDTVGPLTHIAVAADLRHRGIGRALFEAVRARYPAVQDWVAETDDEAVGFYRRLGFSVAALPPHYPGVTRYRCRFAVPSPPATPPAPGHSA